MKHAMIWLISLYRKYISPIKPPCCRFTPTCSAYALEAFKKRGFFVGMILTISRVIRCNPFSKGGYDPVPEKGLRNKKNKETERDIAETTNESEKDVTNFKNSEKNNRSPETEKEIYNV